MLNFDPNLTYRIVLPQHFLVRSNGHGTACLLSNGVAISGDKAFDDFQISNFKIIVSFFLRLPQTCAPLAAAVTVQCVLCVSDGIDGSAVKAAAARGSTRAALAVASGPRFDPFPPQPEPHLRTFLRRIKFSFNLARAW